jgi:hypothetical protein
VHDDVHAAEGGDGLAEETFHVELVGDVGANRDRRAVRAELRIGSGLWSCNGRPDASSVPARRRTDCERRYDHNPDNHDYGAGRLKLLEVAYEDYA